MWAVLYNTRSIYTVAHGPSCCAKGALRAQNILSAVIFNSTCKIKIKFHSLTISDAEVQFGLVQAQILRTES